MEAVGTKTLMINFPTMYNLSYIRRVVEINIINSKQIS